MVTLLLYLIAVRAQKQKTVYLEGVNEVAIQIPHTPPVPERTHLTRGGIERTIQFPHTPPVPI
jgi:hypothetical protein